jgi:hypothetical protein
VLIFCASAFLGFGSASLEVIAAARTAAITGLGSAHFSLHSAAAATHPSHFPTPSKAQHCIKQC